MKVLKVRASIRQTFVLQVFIIGGKDFSYREQPFILHAGQSKACVNISVIHDSVLEQNETFTIEIESMDSRVIPDASRSTTIITIVDE